MEKLQSIRVYGKRRVKEAHMEEYNEENSNKRKKSGGKRYKKKRKMPPIIKILVIIIGIAILIGISLAGIFVGGKLAKIKF